jgi:alpha-ketoglutarate-dependent taurine dioxygenase
VTGAVDVPLGTDVANRNHLPLEGIIGFFVNNLVLRTDLAGDPSCRELIARVREVTLRAYAHQDLPFDQLVKALAPKRRLSATPLFQVLFVLQNAPPWEPVLPGIEVERLDLAVETAKFDLALFLRPAPGGAWHADWTYRTGVFDAAAVARLAGRYSTLLSSLLAQPDAHLTELEMVTDMEKLEQEESSLNRLRGARRRAAEPAPAELVDMAPLADGQALPLVVQPRVRDLDLVGWAASQRDLLESRLLTHGGLLFRGFQVGGVGEFERFAAAIAPDLYGEYGDLPREQEGEKVYQSTPYPADKSILFHNESSHMHRWPLKQWFFCVTPAPVGGATPLLDCRRVYRALDPGLAAEFETKGLVYVRNFSDGLDVSWQEFFRTADRSAVEAWCGQAGLDFQWTAGGLQTRQRARAVAVHPKTGEKVFFNQIQLHHPACLDAETRASLLAVLGEEDLPRNVLFGDGTPIPDAVMAEIGRLYERLAVRFTWQQGDVAMLDNMLTAHGRDPYSGPRKIVVAMGEITTERQLAAE